MKKKIFYAIISSVLLIQVYCMAEEWYPPSAGPVTTWIAKLWEKGTFIIQPLFYYNRVRGTFDSKGGYDSLPDDDRNYQYQKQLFAQYALTDRLEIDGLLDYQKNYAREEDISASSDRFGDSYLYLRYSILMEKDILPYTVFLLQLKLPTGKYEHADSDKLGTDLTGDGSYDPGVGINLTKTIKPFMLHTDLIFSFPTEVTTDTIDTRYGTYINYDFAVEYFFYKELNLVLELNGFAQGKTEEEDIDIPDSDSNYLEISPGIGLSNDTIQTLITYRRTLAGENTDAIDSVVFTFAYTF